MKSLLKFFSAIIIISTTATSCVSNYVTANNSSYKYPSTNEFLLVSNTKGPNAEKYNNASLISKKSLTKSSAVEADLIENSLAEAAYSLITEAKTYLGTPYRYGGTTRNGIDCSSFVQHVFDANNITLPRTSAEQAKTGNVVPRSDLKKGDLIFFAHTPQSRVSHVGIVESVSETGEVFFIHASSSKGVTISSLDMAYWTKRFRIAKRLLDIKQESDEMPEVNIPVLASK